MKVVAKTGNENLAVVYISEMKKGRYVEFVESVQPPFPRDKKWVLIVSTLYGCPVACPFCDAGGYYGGKLSSEDITSQIEYMVKKRFSSRDIKIDKFKIQFARMGEPSYNNAVLDVLEELPILYNAPGLLPCVSTIAPTGTELFFERLYKIKEKYYKNRFQLQFSLHTTDETLRDKIIPVKKWSFNKIAEYGNRFADKFKKVTINFAIGEKYPVKTDTLQKHFSPEKFLIKITPINPTYNAVKNGINSYIQAGKSDYDLINSLKHAGYEVILSIGELEENNIGSNCGQYITNYLKEQVQLENSYTYKLEEFN